MRWLLHDMGQFMRDESATTTLEYALLLALVTVAAILAYRNFGESTRDLAEGSTEQMPQTDGQ